MKELPGPKQLSVRDQAIDAATKAVAETRGVPKHEVGINSRYRGNSEAHKRGAFDLSTNGSKDVSKEARAIANAIGPGFVTIHEQPSADRTTQTNTTYFADGSSKSTTAAYGTPGFHASGEHIHVQPNDVLNQEDRGK